MFCVCRGWCVLCGAIVCGAMGWLQLVGCLRLQVSFAEYHLFYRALLQKRPIILRSLLSVATSYCVWCYCVWCYCVWCHWVSDGCDGAVFVCEQESEELHTTHHTPHTTHHTCVLARDYSRPFAPEYSEGAAQTHRLHQPQANF